MTEEQEETPTGFRWSFSAWEQYNTCPAAWKYRYTLKLPRKPPGPAAARGLDMHSRVEDYIMGRNPDLDYLRYGNRDPAAFGGKGHAVIHEKYIPIFNAYKDHPNGDRWCEKKFAFDKEWYCCSPLSKERAVVGVLDVVRSGGDRYGPDPDHGVVRIGEWKSGKPKDTHADQRKLYAMSGIKLWMADRVEVTTYYLEDTALPQRLVVQASAWPKLVELWDSRVSEMRRNTICAPKPSYACRWCDFSKSNGGPCKFS
jgi:hypothetical protein